jgi:hypothetical protein
MRQRYIRFINMISLSHADVTRPIINPSHILWGYQSHVMGTVTRYAFTHNKCALTHKMRIDALKNQGLTLRETP